MSPTIRVSDDVYEHLQQHAEPFVDTPDSVLRRLLGLEGQEPQEQSADERSSSAKAVQGTRSAQDRPSVATARTNGAGDVSGSASSPARARTRRRSANKGDAARPARAPRGSLLNENAYEVPILHVLVERGGRAGKNEVLDALEPLLGDELTELDRTPLASGEIRWRNRAQFVRLRLVQRGEMKADSPRGIWELAEAGRSRVEDSGVATGQAGTR
jgi:hypothetical protein